MSFGDLTRINSNLQAMDALRHLQNTNNRLGIRQAGGPIDQHEAILDAVASRDWGEGKESRAKRWTAAAIIHQTYLRELQEMGLCDVQHSRNAAIEAGDLTLVRGDITAPGFFTGYLGQGIAQEVHMVPADVGDDGDHWQDHIRRIEPPSQAYLYDSDIHFFLGEIIKGHRDGDLKKRWSDVLDKRAHTVDKIQNVLP